MKELKAGDRVATYSHRGRGKGVVDMCSGWGRNETTEWIRSQRGATR